MHSRLFSSSDIEYMIESVFDEIRCMQEYQTEDRCVPCDRSFLTSFDADNLSRVFFFSVENCALVQYFNSRTLRCACDLCLTGISFQFRIFKLVKQICTCMLYCAHDVRLTCASFSAANNTSETIEQPHSWFCTWSLVDLNTSFSYESNKWRHTTLARSGGQSSGSVRDSWLVVTTRNASSLYCCCRSRVSWNHAVSTCSFACLSFLLQCATLCCRIAATTLHRCIVAAILELLGAVRSVYARLLSDSFLFAWLKSPKFRCNLLSTRLSMHLLLSDLLASAGSCQRMFSACCVYVMTSDDKRSVWVSFLDLLLGRFDLFASLQSGSWESQKPVLICATFQENSFTPLLVLMCEVAQKERSQHHCAISHFCVPFDSLVSVHPRVCYLGVPFDSLFVSTLQITYFGLIFCLSTFSQSWS